MAKRPTAQFKTGHHAAAADPDIEPLDFLRGIYRDPKVDPRLRLDAAKAAFVHAKPTSAPAPDSGPMIIDGHRSIDDAALVAEAERQSVLQQREWLDEFGGEPLTAEERAELKALNAKGEDLEAALPAYLKPIEDPEDKALRDLLMDDDSPAEPPRQRSYENPAAHRKRLLAERQTH